MVASLFPSVAERPPWLRMRQTLEGVVKRVNYKTGEVIVVADCATWQFRTAPDCEFWWDGERTMLRCFHPLDHIRAEYVTTSSDQVLKALHGSDNGSAN